MKNQKMLTSFSILLCLGTAYAQPQKGRSLLGGYFNGGTSTRENSLSGSGGPLASRTKSSNFGIGLNFEYFFRDKLALVAEEGFGMSKTITKDLRNDSTAHERRSNTYRAAVGLTRYFAIKGPLYLGLKNSIYGASSTVTEPDNLYRKDFEETTNDLGYTLNVGLNYFATNRLVISTYVNLFDVSYYRTKSSYKAREQDVVGNYVYNEKSSKSKALNLSGINTFNVTNITVAIQYYFGKKAEAETVK